MRMYGVQGGMDEWIGGIICPSTAAQLTAESNHMYSAFNQKMTNQCHNYFLTRMLCIPINP